jgi:hypothetical protein
VITQAEVGGNTAADAWSVPADPKVQYGRRGAQLPCANLSWVFNATCYCAPLRTAEQRLCETQAQQPALGQALALQFAAHVVPA